MMTTVFRDVSLCSLVEAYRRFEGTCCLHHPDLTASREAHIEEENAFHDRGREKLKLVLS
jgi:hypothetical protein